MVDNKGIKRMDANQFLLYGTPPSACDGADLYIQKLFAQNGISPGDTFQPANPDFAHPPKKSKLDQFVKYAGIAFAGVLGLLALEKLWPAAIKKVKPPAGP